MTDSGSWRRGAMSFLSASGSVWSGSEINSSWYRVTGATSWRTPGPAVEPVPKPAATRERRIQGDRIDEKWNYDGVEFGLATGRIDGHRIPRWGGRPTVPPRCVCQPALGSPWCRCASCRTRNTVSVGGPPSPARPCTGEGRRRTLLRNQARRRAGAAWRRCALPRPCGPGRSTACRSP